MKYINRSQRKFGSNKLSYPFFLLFISFIFLYCQVKRSGSENLSGTDFSSSPIVPPDESISKMKIEEGFEIKLVAAEPLISAPVALTFDAEGRMWVLEMNGYMPDTTGIGEDTPNGKIVILEDKNKDGLVDNRKVYLDSLVLPRALCLIEGGILFAEGSNLWYCQINNDRPGIKTLIDNKYTEGGNVEHQPNGLFRAMDNWIYNANSNKRYRKKGNKWITELTHFRGQWGLSQDNSGRLFYNTNSENLLGDYFTPGFGSTNKNQQGVAGYNEKIVIDTKVYPSRPTPGVNRGYLSGILDSSHRLVNFTAACGPVIYRGDLFGPSFMAAAFVAEPAANLIKLNFLDENGYAVSGVQAYKGKEFLSSSDERFRPVNLYNAPDGSLYVVDMYRGILEHITYMTPYLKDQINLRKLTKPLSCGRIYKIIPKSKKAASVTLPDDPKQLVKLLGHPNGWVRDKAQQMLVDGNFTRVIPALQKAVRETRNPMMVIHSLWALEGLEALRTEEVLALLKHQAWSVRMQALSVLPSVMNKTNYQQYVPALERMIIGNDTLAMPYIAYITNLLHVIDKSKTNVLLKTIVEKYPDNRYVAGAIASGLENREEQSLKEIVSFIPDKKLAIHKELQRVIDKKDNNLTSRDPKALINEFPKGAAIYNSSCQTCHAPDGNGRKSLAPPLNQSEWVTGNKDKLISIVLFGLTGPVKVNGHVYKAPEINGDMPGLGFNKDLSNEEIAQLLSFIRRSWSNNGDKISADEIVKIRQKLKDRQKAFTAEELDRTF